jgi:hypothetical protein
VKPIKADLTPGILGGGTVLVTVVRVVQFAGAASTLTAGANYFLNIPSQLLDPVTSLILGGGGFIAIIAGEGIVRRLVAAEAPNNG